MYSSGQCETSSRAAREAEPAGAIGECRNAELRVPASLEDARAHLEARRRALDVRRAPRESERGGASLVGCGRRLLLQDVDPDVCAGAGRGGVDRRVQARELLAETLLG